MPRCLKEALGQRAEQAQVVALETGKDFWVGAPGPEHPFCFPKPLRVGRKRELW